MEGMGSLEGTGSLKEMLEGSEEFAGFNERDIFFLRACFEDCAPFVRIHLLAGYDVNTVYRDEFTPLMTTMKRGMLEAVKVLLSCEEIKLDATDRGGSTALHYACSGNQPESVKLFLAHPDCTEKLVNKVAGHGLTAEKLAIMNGNFECAKVISEYGMSKNTRTEDTRSEDSRSEATRSEATRSEA